MVSLNKPFDKCENKLKYLCAGVIMGSIMIDILMATYNGENYIAEQLDSISKQTVTDYHILVRDDGSTDSSMQVLEAYQKKYPDKLTVYENTPPSGSAKKNFFRLLMDAEQEYVMFCDQDDIWNPDKIELTLKKMKWAEDTFGTDVPILVHTDLAVADAKGEIISPSFHKYMNLSCEPTVNRLIIQNQVTGCTVMVNRALYKKMQKVRDTEAILMHDQWAALIAAAFGQVIYLDTPSLRYRQHGDNSVGAKNARSLSYLFQRWKQGKGQFRRELFKSMRQVQYFMELYGDMEMPAEIRELLEGYGTLEQETKWKRMRFYHQKKVQKQGTIRRIMQYVWG